LSIIVSSTFEPPPIVIRDIERMSETREVEALQKDVWGSSDLDVVPLTLLVASREVGGILVGAYDGPQLVGFVYGFPGQEKGQVVHHSHMLAVRPSHRNSSLGCHLKLAQRERVLAQGIKRITWTFDPLQSLNAYFNFAKLGVVADTYKINFYGDTTSSFLHQIGTDRLWVSWLLDSRRVHERVEDTEPRPLLSHERSPPLVEVGLGDAPAKNNSSGLLGQERLSIEIPADINALQNENPRLAAEWREATRRAFTDAIAAGYLVEDFYRSKSKNHSVGVYLLSQRKRVDDFA
jgi:predicted GNAT superfamily acetyltransferase